MFYFYACALPVIFVATTIAYIWCSEMFVWWMLGICATTALLIAAGQEQELSAVENFEMGVCVFVAGIGGIAVGAVVKGLYPSVMRILLWITCMRGRLFEHLIAVLYDLSLSFAIATGSLLALGSLCADPDDVSLNAHSGNDDIVHGLFVYGLRGIVFFGILKLLFHDRYPARELP